MMMRQLQLGVDEELRVMDGHGQRRMKACPCLIRHDQANGETPQLRRMKHRYRLVSHLSVSPHVWEGKNGLDLTHTKGEVCVMARLLTRPSPIRCLSSNHLRF